MRPTTIKQLSLAGVLLCLCLLFTAFAAEKNYNICHEKFWSEATAEKVASIPNPEHLCYQGKTPLMYAAESGNPDAVNALVNAGANINAQSDSRRTPLMYAAWNGNPDVLTTLVNAGAVSDTR